MQHLPGLRSTIDSLRDRFAPVRHTSTFRKTGEITPEEFLLAGDYLVHKFPSWAWAPSGSAARQVSYLPAEKQYLVTKHVPCTRRVNGGDFVGGEEKLLFLGGGKEGGEADGDEWVSTGGTSAASAVMAGKTAARSGSSGAAGADAGGAAGKAAELQEEEEEEEEIPDMDASDDESAIIRETHGPASGNGSLRTYNLYITYTPFYRTPRIYLSGFNSQHTPLPPTQMLEDIVGDYSEKTVTLEDFPFFDTPIKMASVHPCRHAAVMKVLLERADAAVKLRRDRQREKDARVNRDQAAVAAGVASGGPGLEGLVEGVSSLDVGAGSKDGDEWEVLQAEENAEDEEAIQVHQYVVVFLKFMASVTPGIEHDFTMGV